MKHIVLRLAEERGMSQNRLAYLLAKTLPALKSNLRARLPAERTVFEIARQLSVETGELVDADGRWRQ